MPPWTSPRLLATREAWFPQNLRSTRPACYELAVYDPVTGAFRWVYIGETSNARSRLERYGRTGAHLHVVINAHLTAGREIWFRHRTMPTKAAAKKLQDDLICEVGYDWNRLGYGQCATRPRRPAQPKRRR